MFLSTFGPSCTEFVCPGCWHFDNDATSKIDEVLTEHGGLLNVPTRCPPEVFREMAVDGTAGCMVDGPCDFSSAPVESPRD